MWKKNSNKKEQKFFWMSSQSADSDLVSLKNQLNYCLIGIIHQIKSIIWLEEAGNLHCREEMIRINLKIYMKMQKEEKRGRIRFIQLVLKQNVHSILIHKPLSITIREWKTVKLWMAIDLQELTKNRIQL